MDLDEIADNVASRETFAQFLEALRADLQRELARPAEETAWGAGDWAHPDLEGFLETWAASLNDLAPESANWRTHGVPLDALDPNAWRMMAEMLLVARVYE